MIRSYTEPVRLNRMKTLARRWWPVLGVVVGVLGYLLWRNLAPDPPKRLFALLPDNHALYAYADVEAMREAAFFFDAATAPVRELIDRRGNFAEYRVFLSEAEVTGAALSVGEHELRAVLSGRFTASALMKHVERQGGYCEDFTCSVDTPEGDMRLRLSGDDLLEIVDRRPRTVELADHGNAAFLAAPARQSIRNGAVLWVALRPLRLEAVMKDPPRGLANLALFARALRQATWAYLTLGYGRDTSSLRLQLEAFTESAEDAQEMHGVLSGLNAFAAAMADRRSGDAGAGPWGSVLDTADFTQQGTTVQALWQIDPALLRSRP
ncbi:MAG: hypothetical protein OXL36_21690 [Bryobacterales bacterium]|nr:hypothetical protein [Bryobacterales bacterium]